jgi:hypothetical protein
LRATRWDMRWIIKEMRGIGEIKEIRERMGNL